MPDEFDISVPQDLHNDIYINEIAFYLKEILVSHFADVTTLLFSERELSHLISKIRSGIFILNDWCKLNKLFVNFYKLF